MYQMLGVFTEFGRALFREKVLAGLGGARARGTVLGPPRLSPLKVQAIQTALRNGRLSLRRIAKKSNVGMQTPAAPCIGYHSLRPSNFHRRNSARTPAPVLSVIPTCVRRHRRIQ